MHYPILKLTSISILLILRDLIRTTCTSRAVLTPTSPVNHIIFDYWSNYQEIKYFIFNVVGDFIRYFSQDMILLLTIDIGEYTSFGKMSQSSNWKLKCPTYKGLSKNAPIIGFFSFIHFQSFTSCRHNFFQAYIYLFISMLT